VVTRSGRFLRHSARRSGAADGREADLARSFTAFRMTRRGGWDDWAVVGWRERRELGTEDVSGWQRADAGFLARQPRARMKGKKRWNKRATE